MCVLYLLTHVGVSLLYRGCRHEHWYNGREYKHFTTFKKKVGLFLSKQMCDLYIEYAFSQTPLFFL